MKMQVKVGEYVTVRGSEFHKIRPQGGKVVEINGHKVTIDVGKHVIEVNDSEVTTDQAVANRWYASFAQ